MRIVLQRVSQAKCVVNETTTGCIEKGYFLLVGFTSGDNHKTIEKATQKITNLRIFEDENQKMNLNLSAVNGKILSVSQFTLYANTNEGNRPSFTKALNPQEAKGLYQDFNQLLRALGFEVEEGIFGAHMDITLTNDGPVTIMYEF